MANLKTCNKCLQDKELQGFQRLGRSTDKLNTICKACRKEQVRVYNATEAYKAKRKAHYFKNKALVRDRQLESKFGITRQEYDELLCDQGGCCAICKREPEEVSDKELAVDHNHQTGKIRGLLCMNCNTALGNFSDDLLLLTSAIVYLKGAR